MRPAAVRCFERAVAQLLVTLLAVLFACPSVAQNARAEVAAKTVQLQFSSVEGCPPAAAFRDRFARLTERVLFQGDPGSERVNVRLWREGKKFAGHVAAPSLGLDRKLSADVCSDLVSALALVTAVAFDPQARVPEDEARGSDAAAGSLDGSAEPSTPVTAAQPSDGTAAASTKAAPEAVSPTAVSPDATTKKSDVSPAEPARLQTSTSRVVDPPPETRSDAAQSQWRTALALGPVLRVGGEPGVGVGGQFELSVAGEGPLRHGYVGVLATRAQKHFSLGVVQLTLATGTFGWCPELLHGSQLAAALCLGAEGGVLVSEPQQSERLGPNAASVRLHAAGFAGVMGLWQLGGRWSLVLRAKAVGVLTQDSFTIETVARERKVVFETKPFGGAAALLVQYEL